MDKDGAKTLPQGEATRNPAPLPNGYNIEIEVDDSDIITFTGKINPKHYAGKAVNQIWTAMFNTARQLTEAWEKHYNE